MALRPRSPRGLALRGVAAALAVVLIAVAIVRYRADAADRAATARMVVETGLWRRNPEVSDRILKEPDPARARLALARALVAEALDPSTFRKLPTRDAVEAVAGIGDRLELAEGMAAAVWRERPANWQAAMLVGAARYWSRARRGDPTLISAREEWEGPLRSAARLAPGSDEPARFLSLALLQVWPALGADDREEAVPLFRRAFCDPQTLRLAAPTWLALSESRETAFDLIPDESWAWRTVESSLASVPDWAGVREARRRAAGALDREVSEMLGEIRERLAGSDAEGARTLALRLVGMTPPDLRYRDAVELALRIAPAGAPSVSDAGAMRRWLEWAMEGAVRGVELMDEDVIARLLSGAGELPASERAAAELASGNLARAEVIERRTEALGLEPWAAYGVLKARILAERGETAAAFAALDGVHRLWRGSVAGLAARIAVAEAAGSSAALAGARAGLAQLEARRWPATAWQWQGPEASLDIVLAEVVDELELEIDVAPERGGVAAVSLDYREVATVLVSRGRSIRFGDGLDAGLHRIVVGPVAGGRLAPGELRAVTRGFTVTTASQ